jgi:hypothetical protein
MIMFLRTMPRTRLLLAVVASLVLVAGGRADDKHKPPPPPPAPKQPPAPPETPERKLAIELMKQKALQQKLAAELMKKAIAQQNQALNELNARINEANARTAEALKEAAFEASLPELNRKVLQFARDHQGKQVGNGECWTLAAEALTSAGAQRPGYKGVGVFDFGRKLSPGESPLPGDILMFWHTKFEHKSTEHIGNKTKTKTSWVTVGNHHTAIVAKVQGKTITYFNQNHNGIKTVGATTINLDDRKEGTIEYFRPSPAK